MEYAREKRIVEIFLAVLYVLVILGLVEIKLTAKVFLFITVLATVVVCSVFDCCTHAEIHVRNHLIELTWKQ